MENLAPFIDHTLLKPEATRADLQVLAQEAVRHGFASVCVNSANVSLMVQEVRGSNVKVCAVVGFPFGAMSTPAKAFEAWQAVADGADEIDMVLNIGALKDQDHARVSADIAAVVQAANSAPVKVILETSKLTEAEKTAACNIALAAGAAFVKTSTGFGGGGATVEDIALMRRLVGDKMGVKASGGVRDATTAQRMLDAGATRIGASASVAIVMGAGLPGSGY